MAKRNYPNIPKTLKQPPPPIPYSGCALGKMKRAPFQTTRPTPLPGQSIASGTCEWDIKSRNGYNHFATFIHESTRYLQVVPLTHRRHIEQHIKSTLCNISLHANNFEWTMQKNINHKIFYNGTPRTTYP